MMHQSIFMIVLTALLVEVPNYSQVKAVDCHTEMDSSRGACEVCHETIRSGVPPTHQGTARITHDDPERWALDHAEAAGTDAQFCVYCHEDQRSACDACHDRDAS